MRYLLLAAFLFTSACAGSRPATAPDAAITAKADSLLSLPVDSLSTSDQAWLGAYSARTRGTEQVEERERTVFYAVMVVLLLGAAGAVWALQLAATE